MGANVLIMAGGTGGHVFPALACAREFEARGYTVHWLGTPRGIENELVEPAGFKLHLINVAGLRGKSKLSLLKAPFVLLKALFQARKLDFIPAASLGTLRVGWANSPSCALDGWGLPQADRAKAKSTARPTRSPRRSPGPSSLAANTAYEALTGSRPPPE